MALSELRGRSEKLPGTKWVKPAALQIPSHIFNLAVAPAGGKTVPSGSIKAQPLKRAHVRLHPAFDKSVLARRGALNRRHTAHGEIRFSSRVTPIRLYIRAGRAPLLNTWLSPVSRRFASY